MEQRRLGRSGLKVSRLGPRHDDLGPRHRRARGRRPAQGVPRGRRHPARHGGGLRRRRVRAGDRRAAAARRSTARTWCSPPRPASPGVPANGSSTPRGGRCSTRWTGRCSGSAPTTSTCGRCTPGATTTALEETLAALDHAVATGRARYVGISNYSGWQTGRAVTLAAGVARAGAAGVDPDGVLAAAARHRARGAAGGGGLAITEQAAGTRCRPTASVPQLGVGGEVDAGEQDHADDRAGHAPAERDLRAVAAPPAARSARARGTEEDRIGEQRAERDHHGGHVDPDDDVVERDRDDRHSAASTISGTSSGLEKNGECELARRCTVPARADIVLRRRRHGAVLLAHDIRARHDLPGCRPIAASRSPRLTAGSVAHPRWRPRRAGTPIPAWSGEHRAERPAGERDRLEVVHVGQHDREALDADVGVAPAPARRSRPGRRQHRRRAAPRARRARRQPSILRSRLLVRRAR